MHAVIGVDPHKATHTAVIVNDREDELARKKVRACRTQVAQLLCWAEPFPQRTWAIEGADGLGYLLAQQLVAAGETVVNVPATLAARTRVLATGRSNKNDPNDALSVAITALRYDGLRRVSPAGHGDVLRLLAKRHTDLGRQRSRQVSRLHAVLVELTPGGIAKEINASDVDGFLAAVVPAGPTDQVRYDLAVELLDDIRRLDRQLKASHKTIRTAVDASGTTVTDIYGVGPIVAAMLIGYTGDVGRFENRDRYAAYNGTAPVEVGSAERTIHRVSKRGNRKLNHAIHLAAITQLRQPTTDGRRYFDRKVDEGKTKREALRSLKRHISNAVYRQLLADARRAAG
ncbi:MAG: IS110 family RNA-guided transposase [Acidimicrobiales bacterium]